MTIVWTSQRHWLFLLTFAVLVGLALTYILSDSTFLWNKQAKYGITKIKINQSAVHLSYLSSDTLSGII